jgi:hypothetical protein
MPKRTHDELLAEVLRRCAGRHLWTVPANPARFSQRAGASKGFPDVVIYGPGGVLYRELKTYASPNLEPGQMIWKYRLKAAGQDWDIWHTRDLDNGRVDAELAALETSDEHTDQFAMSMLDLGLTRSRARPKRINPLPGPPANLI